MSCDVLIDVLGRFDVCCVVCLYILCTGLVGSLWFLVACVKLGLTSVADFSMHVRLTFRCVQELMGAACCLKLPSAAVMHLLLMFVYIET